MERVSLQLPMVGRHHERRKDAGLPGTPEYHMAVKPERAPWWGGQFERMVGLVKRALYKFTGGANFAWSELEEVILDVEITLNNRPLTYLEHDIQLPTLTPYAIMFGQPNQSPEDDSDAIESKDLRKRARYLRRCKDIMWTRWTEEYIRSLRLLLLLLLLSRKA